MKKFEHINATTIDEAISVLSGGKAAVIAGGTDLLGTLKDEILPNYPETLVNIKTIPGMDYIKEEKGMLKIGPLVILADIARSKIVQENYTALSLAAGKVAHPHIREMGTIGGNICQLTRCWYFRLPNNRFFCRRKGGRICFAATGDNRYHSIFGHVGGCLAVNPSDLAPALLVLNAKIKTSERTINIENFWDVKKPGSTVLNNKEIVTEIQVPRPASNSKSVFIKFALRKSIDFPIVNCAAAINGEAARICLNGVFNRPYRVTAVEEAIAGKSINHANADAAGDAAIIGAKFLTANKYKAHIAKMIVKRAILACK